MRTIESHEASDALRERCAVLEEECDQCRARIAELEGRLMLANSIAKRCRQDALAYGEALQAIFDIRYKDGPVCALEDARAIARKTLGLE